MYMQVSILFNSLKVLQKILGVYAFWHNEAIVEAIHSHISL